MNERILVSQHIFLLQAICITFYHLKLFLAMVFFSENKKILSAKILWEKISGPERFKKKN
jgi:hypothetical protein